MKTKMYKLLSEFLQRGQRSNVWEILINEYIEKIDKLYKEQNNE